MEYDVVSKAENVITGLLVPNRWKPKETEMPLTTSQLRKFLSAVSVLKNKFEVEMINGMSNSNVLSDTVANEVKFLKVTIAYQGGREKDVKKFAEKAQLIEIITDIGNSTQKFVKFCKYVEALVAYHKYYGGKDK